MSTRDRVRAALALGVIVGLGGIGTLATWNDTATATSDTFSIGSIDLRLNGQKSITLNPAALAALMPGDVVGAPLPVNNVGNLAFTYTMSGVSTGALAPYLTVGVTTGATVTGTVPTGTCTGGTSIGSAVLSSTPTTLIATPRPLAATTGTESLCIQVTFAASAPPTARSSTASMTLTFTATAS